MTINTMILQSVRRTRNGIGNAKRPRTAAGEAQVGLGLSVRSLLHDRWLGRLRWCERWGRCNAPRRRLTCCRGCSRRRKQGSTRRNLCSGLRVSRREPLQIHNEFHYRKANYQHHDAKNERHRRDAIAAGTARATVNDRSADWLGRRTVLKVRVAIDCDAFRIFKSVEIRRHIDIQKFSVDH